MVVITGILIAGGGSFFLTMLFWRFTGQKSKDAISAFYEKMDTPIDEKKELIGSEDVRQLIVIGRFAIVAGGGILVLLLIPNSWEDRLAILATGSFVLIVGAVLYALGRRSENRIVSTD